MTKAFIERVRNEMIVDTRKYRYILDTTAAIDGWETVTTL